MLCDYLQAIVVRVCSTGLIQNHILAEILGKNWVGAEAHVILVHDGVLGRPRFGKDLGKLASKYPKQIQRNT